MEDNTKQRRGGEGLAISIVIRHKEGGADGHSVVYPGTTIGCNKLCITNGRSAFHAGMLTIQLIEDKKVLIDRMICEGS